MNSVDVVPATIAGGPKTKRRLNAASLWAPLSAFAKSWRVGLRVHPPLFFSTPKQCPRTHTSTVGGIIVDVVARTSEGRIEWFEVPNPEKFTLKEIQQMLSSVGLTYVGIQNWEEK